MKALRTLLDILAEGEADLRRRPFLAPCVRYGTLRVRSTGLAGLFETFSPVPKDFEGFGIFSVMDQKRAQLIDVAPVAMVVRYLQLLKPIRLLLVRRLTAKTWLAYPANLGASPIHSPTPVHLVERCATFDTIVGRIDGRTIWFDREDRSADPKITAALRRALAEGIPNAARSIQGLSGLSPEAKTVYSMVVKRTEGSRLQRALQKSGGALQDYKSQGDHWVVRWSTERGELHTSLIEKRDLTVRSAGICLDGEDRKFDLQSLVGVMENAE